LLKETNEFNVATHVAFHLIHHCAVLPKRAVKKFPFLPQFIGFDFAGLL